MTDKDHEASEGELSDAPLPSEQPGGELVDSSGSNVGDGELTEGDDGASTVQEIEPVRPDFVDDEQDAAIQERADATVAAIVENPSDVQVTAKLYELGQDAMAANTRQVSLMDAKIGPVMKTIAVDNPVKKSLSEISAQLDLVNPSVVSKTATDVPGKIAWIIPWTFSRIPKGDELMARINERRDSVADTIQKLKEHLWQERDQALRNASELGTIANHLSDTQNDLREAVYLGQLIWKRLNQAREQETDPARQQALRYLTNDLSTTVVDLQTVDQLNVQSRLGAETLINNCRQIKKLVGRVTNVLLPSVATALAVKAAAQQQADLVASSRAIMQSAGDTIEQTAKGIRQTSVAIAKSSSEGMIDLDQLEKACSEYETMQEEITTVMDTAEQNARGVTNRLGELNERMRGSVDPLTKARRARELAEGQDDTSTIEE